MFHKSLIQFQNAKEYGGEYYPIEQKQKGDLVFYGPNSEPQNISHVAIYGGNDNLIEASGYGVNCSGSVREAPFRTTNVINKVIRFSTAYCDVVDYLSNNQCQNLLTENENKKCCFIKDKNSSAFGRCKSFDKNSSAQEIKLKEKVEVVLCSGSNQRKMTNGYIFLMLLIGFTLMF